MGIVERKEREKEEMRKLILEAAQKLFLETGFEKVSIRNIADAIEYSPATIYLYFKDKDEIFYVIHENAFDLLDKELRQHDVIADPFERLGALGRTYMQFGIENPDYYELMFIMRAPMEQIKNEEKWKAGECAFGYLLTTLAECLEQKKIRHYHFLYAEQYSQKLHLHEAVVPGSLFQYRLFRQILLPS